MQVDRIAQQLVDVPPVFKPTGTTYAAVFAAIMAGLEMVGASTESLVQQLDLQTAQARWLDFWGLLLVLPRNPNESDTQYRGRLQATLLGGTSTVAGVGAFLRAAFGYNVLIQENFATSSFSITFSIPLTTGQLNTIAAALARIRPAGIPFFPFNVVAGGMFLQTTFFLGMVNAQGAYLEAPNQQYFPNLGPATDSLIVQLPVSYLNLPNNFPT